MDKLKLAHDWYMKHTDGGLRNLEVEVEQAWRYADAMQAEADSRVNKDRYEAIKDGWIKLVEKDAKFYGVGFVRFLNKDGFLSAERLDPKLVILNQSEQEVWQPDWSQAPDEAGYWAMDENGLCIWYKDKPEIHTDQWDFGDVIDSAKSFGYFGNWKDSLRKRP